MLEYAKEVLPMPLKVLWYGPVHATWHALKRFRERAKLDYFYFHVAGWKKEMADSFLRAEEVGWQDDRTFLLDDPQVGIRYVCRARKRRGWNIITCLPLNEESA